MSRLTRVSLQAAASVVVALAALGAIAASTGAVLLKDYPPHLSVEVSGLPGYVYYYRDYNVTIEYANLGREGVHDARVEAWVPAGFSLNGVSTAVTDEPQRFVWSVGDLGPGERGEIAATIRGTLPSDLTGAVYDLPGYVGHTAFVDGFEMTAVLSSGTTEARRTASADTGATISCLQPTPGCFFFSKSTGLNDGTVFDFLVSIGGGSPALVQLQDGESFGIPIPPSPTTVLVIEQPEPGWALAGEPSCDGNGVIVVTGSDRVTVSDSPESTLTPNADCAFNNVPVQTDGCQGIGINYIPGYICVFKETDDETDQLFSFNVIADASPAVAATETLQSGEHFLVPIPPPGATTRVEEIVPDGWELQDVLCIPGNNTNVTTVDDDGLLTITGTADDSVGGWCVFYNIPEEEPEPTPQVPRERTVPNIGAGLSGLFNGQPTPLPTAQAPAALAPSQTIRPPSTGDGGLR